MTGDQRKFHIRPRFQRQTKIPGAELIARLQKACEIHDCEGVFLAHHVVLKIKPAEQHFWSPQLSLEVIAEEDQTKIRGLYGPRPGVWTMFVFIYSLIGFLSVMALMYGFAQLMLKMSPSGLQISLVGTLLLLGAYITSAIGQRFGREQMNKLDAVLRHALAD